MSTLTALRERIEQTKSLQTEVKLIYDNDDAEVIIIENQIAIMQAQVEILELLKGKDVCDDHGRVTNGNRCVKCGETI